MFLNHQILNKIPCFILYNKYIKFFIKFFLDFKLVLLLLL